MSDRPTFRSALAFLQACLLVAACGASTPSQGVAPSEAPPGAPTADPTPDLLAGLDLPSPDGRTIAAGADAELAFVDDLRAQAGIGDLIGPLADDVFAAIADARTKAGEARLPEIAEALGIDLTTAALHVAAGAGAPGSGRPPANEWTGSVVGHATYTVTMMTGMLSGAIANAGVDQPRTTQAVEDHFDTTSGGAREVVDIKTTYTLQTGGGRMFGEIKLETIAVGTDATTGTSLGTILGSATGSIEVNACPDENGIAEGRLRLALQEGMTTTTGPGAGSSHSVDAPFRLVDGDDAHLVRTELDASIEAAAHGPGKAGGDPGAPFDWSMSGFVPISLEKGGGISIDPSGVTTSGNDAADRDVAGAINHAVVGTVMVAGEIGREAEKFWRSGQCIDLKVSEESRKVSPDERIEISVDPVHKFDGGSVKAPVTASFEGTKTLEPANTPVDPPASFDFVAGRDPGEKGTVTLTQTGRRGIGKASLEFEVGASELLVTIRSETSFSPADGIGSDGVFTVEATLKADPSGAFRGEGTWTLTGTYFYSAEAAVHESGCSGSLTATGSVTFTATPDEADPTAVTLTGNPVYNKAVAECAGQGAGDPSIFAGVLNRAFADSIKSVRVTVDGPSVSTSGKENVAAAKTVTTITQAEGASPGD